MARETTPPTDATADEVVRVGERRPGGRAARVRTSVLEATLDLLDEVGYDGLSTDEVAKRAGVHRTTVYRRWPTLAELVADAVGLTAEEQIPIPDTGSLDGDLQLLGRAVAASVDGTANRSRALVGAATASEPLAEALHQFMRNRMEQSVPIVARAIERGELAGDLDPRVVIESVVGAVWFRFLLTGEAVDPDDPAGAAFVDGVAALVGRGARSPIEPGDGDPAGRR